MKAIIEKRICKKHGLTDYMVYSYKGRIHRWCKNCIKNRDTKYRLNNKEKTLISVAKSYQKNKSKYINNRKSWININREKYNSISNKSYYLHKKENKARRLARANKKELLKHKCDVCGGTEKLQMHHPDYDKPLFVKTLCSGCHGLLKQKYNFL